MSGTQTTKLPAQAVTGQNSAALFKALDGAMNRAFDSFIGSLQGRELHNALLVKNDLTARLLEEVNVIKMRVPSMIQITVTSPRDKFEQFFFVKAWIQSSDFEGDTIHITRVLGFNAYSPERELN